jgi:hypothetical protein
MKKFFMKKTPPKLGRSFLCAVATNLFLFVAITTGTLFCITIAGVPYVNGRQSTVLAVVVITTIGYVAANAFVYGSFDHNRYPPCQ